MKIELGKMKLISDVTNGELCIVGLGKETVLALKLQNQIIPLSEHAGEYRFHLTDFGDEAAFVPNNLVLSTTLTSIRSGHTDLVPGHIVLTPDDRQLLVVKSGAHSFRINIEDGSYAPLSNPQMICTAWEIVQKIFNTYKTICSFEGTK